MNSHALPWPSFLTWVEHMDGQLVDLTAEDIRNLRSYACHHEGEARALLSGLGYLNAGALISIWKGGQ